MIEVQGLSFAYGRQQVIRNVSCQIPDGQVTAIIGPNGAGKSTLLRLMAGIVKPNDGHIFVDGRNTTDIRAKEFARMLAFLPQNRPTPALSVHDLVQLGRFAHEKGSHQAVEEAIRTVGLSDLIHRDVRTLSGGQRQMACLAMLLAQEAGHVLMDEPFTHLDIGAQLDTVQVIRSMKSEGKSVAVVMHDLNLLETVCDRVLLLQDGGITFEGTAQECLSSKELEKAFGVRILANQGISFEKLCFT